MSKATKKRVAIILAIVFGLSALAGIATGIYFGVATVATEGTVVDSTSGNPIAGVVVSDGRNVTKTDENGKFELKGWHKGVFVTITTPSEYNATDDIYYMPIDRDKESYDFKLDKVGSRENHTFLQVTDTEINASSKVEGWMGDLKTVVERENPAFIVHTGDICYEEGLRRHKTVMNTENMGVPVRYVAGNHDYVAYGGYGEKLFEEVYGPTWYSFDVGNVHYVVSPMMTYTDVLSRYSKGEFMKWLENDLETVSSDKKIVMFNHDAWEDEDEYVLKAGATKIELREKGLLAWVFGHWHYNLINEKNGVFNISTASGSGGGIDSSPAGIRSVVIENTTIADIHLSYIGYEAREGSGFEWQTKIAGRGLFAEPILDGGYVYVATTDDGVKLSADGSYTMQSSVAKIDIANGNIIWEKLVGNSVKNSMVLKDGKLVVQDVAGNLICFNTEDGAKVWEKNLGLTNLKYTNMGITIDGATIYCGNARYINAVNLENGEILWQTKNNSGDTSPGRYSVYDGKLIVGAHWDKYFAYNISDGKQVWKSEAKGLYTTSTPYFSGDKMVFASNSDIFELNVKTGKIISKTTFDEYIFNVAARPYVEGNIYYFSTGNKGVVAVNMDSKQIVWNYETGKAMMYSSPYTGPNPDKAIRTVEGEVVSVEDKLIFGASDGYIHVVNKADGTLIKKLDVGSAILSKVVVKEDMVFCLDFEGNVSAFKF